MIVEFSVKNFRSIKDLQTISFAATGLKSPDEYANLDETNIAEEGGMHLLKTVGIYGANASGKSNIILAFLHFISAINNEARSESNLNALCDPFLFQENADQTESFFQLVFYLKEKKYRYGFTVKRNPSFHNRGIFEKSSKEIISSEWLFGTKDKNMVELFTRKGLEISKDKLPGQEIIPSLSYEHTLFLTHASAFDNKGVCAGIRRSMQVLSNLNIGNYASIKELSYQYLTDLLSTYFNGRLLNILSIFNVNYLDIEIEKDEKMNSLEISTENVVLIKKNINSKSNGDLIRLNLFKHESTGTQKIFEIACMLVIVFELNPAFFILDEIDSNFHPSLLLKLIEVFNNPKINTNNSQLLFTSHDTNLMSPSVMRRDQFYFTEKREDDSTRLYSLADLKGIRNDADFARDYLRGFYGALPVFSNYVEPIKTEQDGSVGN